MTPRRIPTGMLLDMIDGIELKIQKRIDSYKVKKDDKVRDGGPAASDSARGATPPFSAPIG